MFGKRRQQELEDALREIKQKNEANLGVLENDISHAFDNAESIKEKLIIAKSDREQLSRDLSYVSILSGEALEEVNISRQMMRHIKNNMEEKSSMKEIKPDLDFTGLRDLNSDMESIISNDKNRLESINEQLIKAREVNASIKEMAGQTSGLSLSAAITGSRLDQGENGFVQTANDIKDLSSRCSQATNELAMTLTLVEESLTELLEENARLKQLIANNIENAKTLEELYKESNVAADDEMGIDLIAIENAYEKLEDICNTGRDLIQTEENGDSKMEKLLEEADIQINISKRIKANIKEWGKVNG